MTDLNNWVLAYPGQSFAFGTLADNYPFDVQVDIGDPDSENQDNRHPTSDGVIMGSDSLGGRTLTFSMITIPGFPLPAKPWDVALDRASAFMAVWRGGTMRRNPGSYATITNQDRGRLAFGRPRKASPNMKNARKGKVSIVATFDTVSPDFYSTSEKSIQLVPNSGGSNGGDSNNSVVRGPGATVAGNIPVSGDVETWPVIVLHGPGTSWEVEAATGNNQAWTFKLEGALTSGQEFLLDTRPWRRSATINGGPATGRLAGSQIDKMKLPVGNYNIRVKADGTGGNGYGLVTWRDAFASI